MAWLKKVALWSFSIGFLGHLWVMLALYLGRGSTFGGYSTGEILNWNTIFAGLEFLAVLLALVIYTPALFRALGRRKALKVAEIGNIEVFKQVVASTILGTAIALGLGYTLFVISIRPLHVNFLDWIFGISFVGSGTYLDAATWAVLGAVVANAAVYLVKR